MSRWARGAQPIALAVALAASACGFVPRTATDASARGTGVERVTVLAAASLTEAFGDLRADLKADLTAAETGPDITYSFAGSGTLVAQIEQGAPADVIATADAASMRKLADAGLVEPSMTFARNKLEVLVEPGNPKSIAGLADLSRADIKLVLGDESVPAGRYAAQALAAAGVHVKPVSKEADVKAAVAKVAGGEADVTLVYVSDVMAAGARAQGIEIPDAQNVVAEYPIAVVKASRHRAAATAFVDAVVHGPGQEALRNRGFLPAA